MKNLATILMMAVQVAAIGTNETDNRASAKTASTTAAKTQSFDGWVSDDKCGVNINAECSKKCLTEGAKVVFVNLQKVVIPVSNQQALRSFVGQRVQIQGKMDNGALSVSSVKVVE